MMGHRQVEQPALFYEFSLERHIPADHLLRSIDRSVPSAWHGTALHSGRSGRYQCACGEGAGRQANDHRFGQHGCSAELSIVLENGPSFALVNRTRRLLHRPGHKRPRVSPTSILRTSPDGARRG